VIVFLHPIGLDGDCWQLLRAFDGNRINFPTLLGHGDRPLPLDGLSISSMARDVVSEWTEPTVDLVGLSMGGAVAQRIALDFPDRVRSLMLVATTAGQGGGARQLQNAASVEAGGMAGILDETLTRWFTDKALSDPGHPGVAYARRRLLSDDPVAFAAAWRALAAHDTVESLGQITVPTTVVHCTGDRSFAHEVAQDIARRVANGRLVQINSPHMAQLEVPELLATTAEEHLRWSRS
jgi:3-oxoadipate enol-lactonase